MTALVFGVGQLGTQTINTSETDTVAFNLAGTLDVTGTAASPIVVTLSQVTNLAVAATINITYATLNLNGAAGAAIDTNYDIGTGGILDFTNVTSVGLGTNINFTGANGIFRISTLYTPTASTGFSGFGPGKEIDITSSAVTNIAYATNSTPNTGGTLTIYGAGNQVLNTLALTTGQFAPTNFGLIPDGLGGTIIQYDSIVSSVTATPANGVLGPNRTVDFGITLSNPVGFTGGVPTLTLSDGGIAYYNSTTSTPSHLDFTYTVTPGQNSSGLSITNFSLNGATDDTLAGGGVNTAGIIGSVFSGITIDTIAPTLTSVSTNPGSGALVAGESVIFNVATSEPVIVLGAAPDLLLNDGGTAIYDSVSSTATDLVFRHIVQPGQNAADLSVIGDSLNGGSITDLAGNLFNLASAIGNPAGLLSVGNIPAGATSITSQSPGTSPTTPGVPADVSVYRFFETTNGTHFYTTDPNERANILATRPDLVSEGVGLRSVNPASNDPGAVEVYRFFDTTKGTQFLTASSAERDSLISSRPDLRYEPEGSFFEHVQPQANDTAVYRFFSSTDGTHFYTDSPSERANIIQTRPDLVAEGIGFYEPA